MIKISYVKSVLYETVLIKDLVVSTNSHTGLEGVYFTLEPALSLSLSLSLTLTKFRIETAAVSSAYNTRSISRKQERFIQVKNQLLQSSRKGIKKTLLSSV
jgi:hypothetical protein